MSMTTAVPKFGFKPQYPNGLKGYLVKRGHVMKNWKQRYFVLGNSELKYYTDESCAQLQGGYNLSNVSFLNSTEMEGRKWVIVVEAEKMDSKKTESLAISAASAEERDNWLLALEETIHGGYPSVEVKGVWAPFYPSISLSINYPKFVLVDDGNSILPSAAALQPAVNFAGAKDIPSDVYHTLIMINADHCQKGITTNRGIYLHWLVLNIPSNAISKGNEVVKYQGPAPFKGSSANRYFFLLFRQSGGPYGSTVLNTTSEIVRENFNLSRWTMYLNLTNPVGINGFHASYESGFTEETLHIELGMIPKPVAAVVPPPLSVSNTNGSAGASRSGSFISGTTTTASTASPTSGSSPSSRRSSGSFVDENELDKQIEQMTLSAKNGSDKLAPVSPPKELDQEARLDALISGLIQANPELPSSLKKYPRMPGVAKKVVTFMICNPALMSDPQPVTSSFYEDAEEGGGGAYDDNTFSDYQINCDPGVGSSPIRINPAGNSDLRGLSINTQMINSVTSGGLNSSSGEGTKASPDNGEGSPVYVPFPATGTPPPHSPLGRRTSSSGSIDPNSPGVGSNRSLIPLMQRLAGINDTKGFCTVFAISTESVFEGVVMRKKFSKDMIMKESFVWIDPLSKSIHWAKSASEKNVTHKHILLDKNSSYTIIGGSPSGVPSNLAAMNHRKQAGGTQMGVIKGAELDDLTITIATEDDQRLKIKIPPELPNASLSAKEWFKVIKLLTQDTVRSK